MASNEHSGRTTLTDTVPGRLLDAGLVGACVAVPDFVPEGRGRRALAQTGLSAVYLAAFAVADRGGDNPEAQPAAEELAKTLQEMSGKAWAILGAVVGASGLVAWLTARGTQAAADALEKRGVKYPFTIFGLLAAGGVFALNTADIRVPVPEEDEHA